MNKRDVLLERLDELAELKDGWLDGSGVTPTKEALLAAETFLLVTNLAILNYGSLFPTEDGSVLFESCFDYEILFTKENIEFTDHMGTLEDQSFTSVGDLLSFLSSTITA